MLDTAYSVVMASLEFFFKKRNPWDCEYPADLVAHGPRGGPVALASDEGLERGRWFSW